MALAHSEFWIIKVNQSPFLRKVIYYFKWLLRNKESAAGNDPLLCSGLWSFSVC